MNRLLSFVLALMCLLSPARAFRRQRAPYSLVLGKASTASPRQVDDITLFRGVKKLSQQRTSLLTSNSLQIRGGGVVGTILQTAWQNPILVLLMAGTSATTFYKEDIPHAKHLQSLLQICIVVYVFRMLVTWQKEKEAEMSS